MAPSQLRISGPLQAAVIAVALGFLFRDATGPASTWPYVVGGYGFLAAVLPWLAGGMSRRDFTPGFSLVLGVMAAAPVALGGWWLAATPYVAIAIGCWVLVALWVAHLVISLALRLRPPGPP